MLLAFQNYISTNKLFEEGQAILIAISGGADSVVLAHLFHQCKFPFALAHCNFALRGEDSDGDEAFVQSLAKEFDCDLFVTRFDTKAYAAQHKLSIEMAARDLRYAWFETIRVQHGYAAIATAHHQEDNAETILLNLIRGTGFKGLLGIKNTNSNHIIRPLLFATKAMILDYVAKNGLTFRTDASNFESIYKRNKLRNEVFPLLKTMNPSVVQTLNDTASRLSKNYLFYAAKIREELAQMIVLTNHDEQSISIIDLQKSPFAAILLFEWLQPFGFNDSDIDSIIDAFTAQSGKQFTAGSYTVVKDRDTIVLSKTAVSVPSVYISADTNEIHTPLHLCIEKHSIDGIDYKNANNNTAILDASRLHFPLCLRLWQEGDAFIPLGMKHHKKLSDFFIDCKVPLNIKKQSFVLVDASDTIVWVVGYRIADTVKVSAITKTVYSITKSITNYELRITNGK
jgi:tRNA(Ile)-lysidine synthase